MSCSVRALGLSYAYPDGRVALDDVELAIAHGERVAILGPNGAGKTTLMLHLNGLLRACAGDLEVAGIDVGETDRRRLTNLRARVGLVFQDPDDQLFMPTVREDVAFGPRNAGVAEPEVDTRVRDALHAVGMEHAVDRPPHALSMGERRRVAIATVLSSDPALLVLDEPSANLDPRARRGLIEVLQRFERTLLVVTHDLPLAAELTDRSIVLDGGRVVADGPTHELLQDEAMLERHGLELPYALSTGSSSSAASS